MPEEKAVLKGVCCLHLETGTEGAYWAFQDEKFIKKNVIKPWCKKCGKYLKTQDSNIKVERVLPVADALSGKKPTDCPDGEHEQETGEEWSYEGLHVLKNGDKLKIFSQSDPQLVVWSGTISLIHYPCFTEDALGVWIHDDQQGIQRETWAEYFFKEYPAELIKAE